MIDKNSPFVSKEPKLQPSSISSMKSDEPTTAILLVLIDEREEVIGVAADGACDGDCNSLSSNMNSTSFADDKNGSKFPLSRPIY